MCDIVDEDGLKWPVVSTYLVKVDNSIDVHYFILALDLCHVTLAFATLTEQFETHDHVEYLDAHIHFIHFLLLKLFFPQLRLIILAVLVLLRNAVCYHLF